MYMARKAPGEEYALKRDYEKLGSYLAEQRKKAGLTQREVSLHLGYSSAQFISNFERGISSPPNKRLKSLVKLIDLKEDKLIKLSLEGQRLTLSSTLKARS
jgi:transcriptional regulator with XRE-family HTH domain